MLQAPWWSKQHLFSTVKWWILKSHKLKQSVFMILLLPLSAAFTELQISVLTVSGDVEGSGIPFRNYRGYTSMVLFPDNPDHPALKEIPVAKEKVWTGCYVACIVWCSQSLTRLTWGWWSGEAKNKKIRKVKLWWEKICWGRFGKSL